MRRAHVVLLLLIALVAVACGAATPVRVGVVTDVNGLQDGGLNALANAGRLEAERGLGVSSAVIESRDAANYVANLTFFAQGGYDLTVAAGAPMGNATWKVARQFANAKFAVVDGAPLDDSGKAASLPNVANLVFAEQQAGYLAGVVAAEMLKGKFGRAGDKMTACALGGAPSPSVDRFIAGYQDALERSGVKWLVDYAGSFTDQEKAKAIGLEHFAKGCTVFFQVAGVAGLGYIQAAKEKNVYAIGSGADQAQVAPETVLTSAVKRADRAVLATIRALRDGRFAAGDAIFSAANDGVGYGRLHRDVPSRVRDLLEAALRQMRSGELSPRTEARR